MIALLLIKPMIVIGYCLQGQLIQLLIQPMHIRKQDLEKDILQKQKEIARFKEAVLLHWAAYLLTSPHRCLLSIIADKHFRSQPLPIAEVEKFKNGANLLRDLEAGLLIKIARKEKGGVEVRINRDFFPLLPTLIDKMNRKICPVIEQLQRFGSDNELKICRGCETLRTKQEITFIGEICNCDLPQFQPVEGDPVKLARLVQIKTMLQSVAQTSKAISDLASAISQLYNQIDRLSRRRMTEYEQLVKKYSLENPSRDNLQITPQQLRDAAFEEITDKMRYKKVEQLNEVKSKRQQHKNDQTLQKCPNFEHLADTSYSQPQFTYSYEPTFQKRQATEEAYSLQALRKDATFIRRYFEKKEMREQCQKHYKIFSKDQDQLSELTDLGSSYL